MRQHTKDYVSSLQEHIEKNYKRWFKTYMGLRGVHVGKKRTNGKTTNNYAIVFHVDKKIIGVEKKVPPFLRMNHQGSRIMIPTDIIEAGALELQGIKMGDTVRNTNSTKAGTIGLYMQGKQGMYLCSNMHVLAPGLLNAGKLHYDIRKVGTPKQYLEFYDEQSRSDARLIISKFNGIDFGIAQLMNPSAITKNFKGYGPMTGFLTLTKSNYPAYKMLFSGWISGAAKKCKVVDLGAIKETAFKDIYLTNLIKLQRCTEHGDSGAPLYDLKGRLAGIMVGFDEDSSYALHINDLIKYFQSSNL